MKITNTEIKKLRKSAELFAKEQNVSLLEILTKMQTGAAVLNDGEKTLEMVTALKTEILKEKGIL